MAYTKQTFTAGQTLKASDLNTMSQGIVENKVILDKVQAKTRLGWYETVINPKKIATLTRVNSTANGHSFQGATIYKNMLFAAMNNNGEMLVYDLYANKQSGSIVVPEITNHHNNNINFGPEFYSDDDEFPLLYMSQENNAVHKCVVARITRNGATWNYEHVQTITFPTPEENGMFWANSYIDAENNYIYLMGYKNESWTDPSNDNRLVSRRWKLPKLSDGDVTLKVADSTNYHETPFWIATQGALFKDGKLYQVYSMPSYKDWLKFRVLDLENGVVERVLELYTRGFTTEPEGIGYYNGYLYVVDVNGNIFKLEFEEEPLQDTYEPLPSYSASATLTEEELNAVLAENTRFGSNSGKNGSIDGFYSGASRVKIYINNAVEYDPKGLIINCDTMPSNMKYGTTLFNWNVSTAGDLDASGAVYDSGNVYGGWSTTTTTHDFTPYSGWVRYQTTVAKIDGTNFTEAEYNAVVEWWKSSVRFTTTKP